MHPLKYDGNRIKNNTKHDFLTSELTVSPLSQRILMANLMSKPIQFVDSDMFQVSILSFAMILTSFYEKL